MSDIREETGLPVSEVLSDAVAHPVPSSEATESDAPSNGELRERSFAHGLHFYKLCWIFLIGSFLGVVVETIWCLVLYQKFESRQGVIYGPFNPVYGCGALVLTCGLHWLIKKRDLWVFLGSAVLGSGVEFVCSWVQETVFGSVSWQYDNTVLNLQGRINLLHGLLWGLLGLLWVKEMYPRLSHLIEKIPNKVGVPLTWVLAVFMVFDLAISGFAVARQYERHSGEPASNAFEAFLDEHYPDEYLSRIYTNLVEVRDETDPPAASVP